MLTYFKYAIYFWMLFSITDRFRASARRERMRLDKSLTMQRHAPTTSKAA